MKTYRNLEIGALQMICAFGKLELKGNEAM